MSNIPISVKIRELIRKGFKKSDIVKKIMESEDIAKEDAQYQVDLIIDSSNDYNDVQKVLRSKRVIERNSTESKFFLYDPVTRETKEWSERTLKELFGKFYKFIPPASVVDLTYDPKKLEMFFVDKKGSMYFNQYKPPEWLEDIFFSEDKKEIEKVESIPDKYRDFLIHLVDGDDKSYNYILDWLATAIQGRNFCYLVTVGTQGIGKGVLGNIMKALVGDSNYYCTNIEKVTGQFNYQISNKQIIQFDEFSIKSKKEEEIVKSLVNEIIEIERKRKDAINIKNHGNYYFTSNSFDSVKITEEDRRFSVVNLTEKKLLNMLSGREINNLHNDKDSIRQLGMYLYHRQVDQNKMMQPFISERTEEIKVNSLDSWEFKFIHEMCRNWEGTELSLQTVIDSIVEQMGTRNRVGLAKLQRLSESYSKVFKIIKGKKNDLGVREYKVKFFKSEDSKEKKNVVETGH
jgi:nucleoid DNA-binding protein